MEWIIGWVLIAGCAQVMAVLLRAGKTPAPKPWVNHRLWGNGIDCRSWAVWPNGPVARRPARARATQQ